MCKKLKVRISRFHWLKIKLKYKRDARILWFFNILEVLRIVNFLNLTWIKIQY